MNIWLIRLYKHVNYRYLDLFLFDFIFIDNQNNDVPDEALLPISLMQEDIFKTSELKWTLDINRIMPNVWINGHNSILTSILGFNTDVQFTLNETKNTIIYISKYVSKPQKEIYNALAMVVALQRRQQVEAVNNWDNNSTAIRRLLSMFMAMTKGQEIENGLAGLFFVKPRTENPISYSSHRFASLPFAQIKAYLLNEDITGEMIDSDESGLFFNTFTLTYISRGAALEDMGVFQFVMWYELVKNSSNVSDTVQEDIDGDLVSEDDESSNELPVDANDEGEEIQNNGQDKIQDCFSLFNRPKESNVKLLSSHPFFKTHTLKRLKKPCIPEFKGAPLPRIKLLDWPESPECDLDRDEVHNNRERYALSALALFKPWRIKADLQLEGTFWRLFMSLYGDNQIPLYARQFLNRMEEVVSCPSHVTPDLEADTRQVTTTAPANTQRSVGGSEPKDGDHFAVQESQDDAVKVLCSEAKKIVDSHASILQSIPTHRESNIQISVADMKAFQKVIINGDGESDTTFFTSLSRSANVSTFLLRNETIHTRVTHIKRAMDSISV
jgi:hypothetical protein